MLIYLGLSLREDTRVSRVGSLYAAAQARVGSSWFYPSKTTPHDDVLIAVKNDTHGVKELCPKVRQRPRSTRCHSPVTRPLHPCSASPLAKGVPKADGRPTFGNASSDIVDSNLACGTRLEIVPFSCLLWIEIMTCKKINGRLWAPP